MCRIESCPDRWRIAIIDTRNQRRPGILEVLPWPQGGVPLGERGVGETRRAERQRSRSPTRLLYPLLPRSRRVQSIGARSSADSRTHRHSDSGAHRDSSLDGRRHAAGAGHRGEGGHRGVDYHSSGERRGPAERDSAGAGRLHRVLPLRIREGRRQCPHDPRRGSP